MFPAKCSFVAQIAVFLLVFTACSSAQAPTDPGPSSIRKIAFESAAGYSGGGTGGSRSGVESSSQLLEPLKSDIYVRDPIESKPRWIAEGEFPAWSPDGSRLVYCVRAEGEYGQIRIVNADGKRDRQLTHLKSGTCFTEWSPDGKQIAITLTNGVWSRIAIIDENGNLVRDLGDGREAHWSPDGRWLVVVRSLPKSKRGGSIWIIGSDGSGERKILEDASNVLQASWLPNGQGILFTSARNGWSGIFRVGLHEEDDVLKVGSDPLLEWYRPVLSPDGRVLIVETETRADSSVHRMSILEINGATHQARMLAVGRHLSILWSQTLSQEPQNVQKSESVTR